ATRPDTTVKPDRDPADIFPPPVLRGRAREGACGNDVKRAQPPPQPSPGVPGAGVRGPPPSLLWIVSPTARCCCPIEVCMNSPEPGFARPRSLRYECDHDP